MNPTVTITDDQAGVASDADNTVVYKFEFNEDVTGFTTADVTVTGGTKGTFNAVDGNTYTVEVTADDNSTTNVSVTAGNTGVTDANGNTMAADATNAAQVVDTVNPVISSEAITTATGVQNSYLNAGDVVTVTVTFSEAVVKTGSPRLALDIGGTPVYAAYASGSGTTALTFTYTILAGQTDVNGISIPQDALDLNGGTITDLAGNTATITKAAVTDNGSYKVDTTAPTQTVSAVDISADTGTSAADFITKTAAQTVTGTLSGALDANDILYGSVDNGATWTDITNKVSGTTITWNTATLSGSSSIAFKIGDKAGNTETANTGTTAYVLDTTAPTPTVTSVVYNNTTNQFTITGTGLNDGTLDFTKMTYQFDGSDGGATMTFTGATEVSRSATEVVVVLTGGDAASLESNNKFGGKTSPVTVDDSFRLDAVFQTDDAGNTSLAVTPTTTVNFVWAGNPTLSNAFTGSAGNDAITGGALADNLSGGNGNDTIRGAEGGDNLSGGNGADTFIFEGSADTFLGVDNIVGFVSGTDVLDFSAFSSSPAVAVAGSLTTTAGKVYVLSGQAAGSADSAAAVATALSNAANWTGADAVAWVVVSDNNSASVWEWTDTAASANEVAADELVQVASISGMVNINDLYIV